VIAGHAEDLAGPVLVADGGMAGADAEIGGGESHRVGGLPEVVVIEEPGAVVIGPGDRQREGGGGSGDVPRAAPDAGQRAEPVRVGDDDEVPVLPLDADGARQAASAMRSRSAAGTASVR
jgi:hypothetical protein